MNKTENFYRRKPLAALNDQIGLSLEERAVYGVIVDLLYSTWRPLEDNRAFIAGWCGCAVQKINPIVARLLEKKKLIRFERDEIFFLTDRKFEEERAAVKGKGAAPVIPEPAPDQGELWGSQEKVATSRRAVATTRRENNDLTPPEKRREEKNSVPNGTGAKAPPDPERAFKEIEALDPDKRSWKGLKFVLTARGGLTDARAGDVVGKLVRDHKLTAGEMWDLAAKAWATGTEAPVQYLAAAAREVAARRGTVGRRADDEVSERQMRSWMEDWAESGAAAWRRHQRGPYPGEAGCLVSPAILREFGVEPHAPPEGGNIVPFPPRSAA